MGADSRPREGAVGPGVAPRGCAALAARRGVHGAEARACARRATGGALWSTGSRDASPSRFSSCASRWRRQASSSSWPGTLRPRLRSLHHRSLRPRLLHRVLHAGSRGRAHHDGGCRTDRRDGGEHGRSSSFALLTAAGAPSTARYEPRRSAAIAAARSAQPREVASSAAASSAASAPARSPARSRERREVQRGAAALGRGGRLAIGEEASQSALRLGGGGMSRERELREPVRGARVRRRGREGGAVRRARGTQVAPGAA